MVGLPTGTKAEISVFLVGQADTPESTCPDDSAETVSVNYILCHLLS